MAKTEHQVAELSPELLPWIAEQSPEVRREIRKFLAKASSEAFSGTEAEAFLSLLSAHVRRLPAGLLEPYHELWCCVPSMLAFQIAVHQLRTPGEVQRFTATAERALLDQSDVQLFEALWRVDDPLDEIQAWLSDRAYMRGLPDN